MFIMIFYFYWCLIDIMTSFFIFLFGGALSSMEYCVVPTYSAVVPMASFVVFAAPSYMRTCECLCVQPQFLGVLDHRNGQEGPAEWVSEQDSNRRDYYYETVENAKGGASSYSSLRRQECKKWMVQDGSIGCSERRGRKQWPNVPIFWQMLWWKQKPRMKEKQGCRRILPYTLQNMVSRTVDVGAFVVSNPLYV